MHQSALHSFFAGLAFLTLKRNGLFEMVVSNGATSVHETKWKALLDLCKTRWAEHHTAYQHFYQAYTRRSLYSDWNTSSRSDSQQHLSRFNFIIVFLTIYQTEYLSRLSGVTVQLQSTTLDILEAHTI